MDKFAIWSVGVVSGILIHGFLSATIDEWKKQKKINAKNEIMNLYKLHIADIAKAHEIYHEETGQSISTSADTAIRKILCINLKNTKK